MLLPSSAPESFSPQDPETLRKSTLHELVGAQAERTPHAPALISDLTGAEDERVLSYQELHRRSRTLAGRLRAWGVGPETIVAVVGTRSPDLIVALLAILEAGGAYLPLEPDDPPERIRLVLDEVRPPLILIDPRYTRGFPEPPPGTRVLPLDGHFTSPSENGGATAPGARNGRESATERNLAYVLYTSGSSGRPKGVMIEHRSIVNRVLWARKAFDIGPADAILLKTPLAFDVAVTEIFWPLVSGASIVLARPEGHRDPQYIADLVERERVSVLHFVPSMLPAFLELGEVATKCRSVRHVLAGGEVLSPALATRFYDVMPLGAVLHNLYGPTEAAVAVTHWQVPRSEVCDAIPIGRPIANTNVYVLDEKGAQSPPGMVGELYVAGVQVARGYLGRPELTGERFLHDPFSGEGDDRMYRTGDRARWLPGGALEFLGRLDRQVKVRGVRIEPGEVEAALLRVPGVREAVVLLREDRSADARLVAYLVGDEAGLPGHTQIREALIPQLPEAMIPTAFLQLEELPRGPTEKVDLARLPAPERTRPELAEPYAPPRDELERFLAALWSEVLGVEPVGIHDRFFELGGTSLQAARIVNRVAEELQEPVYAVTLFEQPTVAAYAAFLGRTYAGAADRSGVMGRRVSPLDEDEVARFRAHIHEHVTSEPHLEPGDRNPPALFILAPPRSGTTLLRVMLAGHSGIFAAPELQLLNFTTLSQRRTALSGKQRHWLEGTVRTLMELEGSSPEEAWQAMAAYEAEDLDTREFYRLLQQRAAPRLLADKTPQYALEPAALGRAEREFRDPLYIHLVRHPWATIRSFREQRLEQLLFLEEHDFPSERLAELVWLESHRNVVEFLDKVLEDRWIRIRFEDLVARPEATLRALCRRLRLAYEPEMADPYRGLKGKMVDGVHPESMPMGDRKLLQKNRVDPSAANRHLEGLTRDALSPLSWSVARELGYELPVERPESPGPMDETPSPVTQRARLRRSRLAEAAGRKEAS